MDTKTTPPKSSKQTLQIERTDMPLTRVRLKQYLRAFLKYRVPDRRVCGHHASPFDYLWHTYSCDLLAEINRQKQNPKPPFRYKQLGSGDCIVWANRGGGKTQLAAIATLLEGLFKEKCQTLILAGSLDQSGRMYDYLGEFVEIGGFKDFIEGKMLSDACTFTNGTTVEVLSQSSRSVRGRHVNKLRCDEIELFDEDVFNAAKFITQSTRGHAAAMEMFSTLHRPYGLMQKIIENAAETKTPVFQWCLWEVIERCRKSDRSCSRCPLNSDCGGKARRANGYLKIDDCIAQMRRSSRAGFESEMLCLRPNLENAVFDEFNPDIHVRSVSYDPALPLYRAMDFGFTNPFVCLWMQVDAAGIVRVIDEYVQKRRRIAEHGKVVMARTRCSELQVMTYCDPAGAQVNGVSGCGEVKVLTDMGMRLKHRPSKILEGIELIRAHLCAGDGSHRLIIDPRCKQLIEAMQCYHYPNTETPSELPKKDGKNDHPIDALRYFFVNFYTPRQKASNRY